MNRWAPYALGGLAALVGGGAAYQAVAEARDRLQHPPPGRMVDVDGHRLHLQCAGEGKPTVVLEAGLATCSLDWWRVQPEVAKFARVCAYDRAGHGWSEPGPRPRTSQRLADELHTLLGSAGIEGPYVLVGHSYGGEIVRMFASRYPEEVAGLVLVDSSHEDQKARVPPRPLLSRFVDEVHWQWYRLRPIQARVGWLRLRHRPNGVIDELPAELQPTARAIGLYSRAYDWLYDEGPAIEASAALMRAAPPLSNIPLVVLSAHYRATPPRGLTVEQMEQVWMGLQQELASLLPGSKHVIAEESGHFIMLDQPELVIDAIREVVDAARRRSSTGNAA
jgi:pimeloyl-ACP methyl ester carboxylesterase